MNFTHLTVAEDLAATHVSSRPFYAGMAISFLAAVAFGFSNSYRARVDTGAPALPTHVVVHGVLFASWFVIFLAQTALARANRFHLHRSLGSAAAVIAALIVVNGPVVAVSAARRGTFPGDPIASLPLMIGDVVGFGVFVAAAFYQRRNSEVHKRLMLLATTSLLPPAITRWPVVTGSVAAVAIVMVALLAAPLVRDLRNRRRPHPVSLWGGFALLASVPLRIAISQTAAWQGFATWLIRT